MSRGWFFLTIMLALGIIAGVVIAVWSNEVGAQDDVCSGKGAERVTTGQGLYICVTPDGRVVGWNGR